MATDDVRKNLAFSIYFALKHKVIYREKQQGDLQPARRAYREDASAALTTA